MKRAMSSAPKKLWGGAFSDKEGPDPIMEKFNASIGFDKALCMADIAGSKAYARALGRSGVLKKDEVERMCQGLDEIRNEWSTNSFEISWPGDEDIHTANERRLGEVVGPDLAGRLHTGRSRNDQVATDLRLWLRREVYELRGSLRELILTARDIANDPRSQSALMPGYTHLQRAQPIRWSHFVLSHAWAWSRDCDRLDALFERSDACPLGSGALAGHPFFPPGERLTLAKELGFSKITDNSLDAVADRDFCIDFAQWAALLGAHLARWSEDLIIYGSAEFGFVQFGGKYSTGSSLMPQKRNPDALELIRGKAARLQAAATQLIALISKLPSAYNKDLQEDKEAVFDVAATLRLVLPVAKGVLSTLTITPEKMQASLVPAMLATDLAEYLVRKGVPFRETHHIAGRAVRLATEKECTIADLSLADLQSLHPAFEHDVHTIFDFEASVQVRDAEGGTSLRAQQSQIASLDAWLEQSQPRGPTADSVSIVSPLSFS